MTRVDFYVVADAAPDARANVACRLAAKAFERQVLTHVHTADAEGAAGFDRLLWTFRDDSFVPHCLVDDPLARDELDAGTVLIGHGHEPAERCELLINLAHDVPRFFSRVTRVAEIIDGDDERRAAGRERFAYYRDRGYAVTTHKL